MSNNTRLAALGDGLDSRYTMSKGLRRQINKVFPTHWSCWARSPCTASSSC